MIEEFTSIKSTRKDLKNFGFTIGFILLIIGGVLFYKENFLFVYFLSIGSMLIGLGGIAPSVLMPIYKIWMICAVIIGWIMTRVILSVLFFSIITTIGIFTRLIGKDFLSLKSRNQKSYWNSRDREYELNQDYEKQF
ncbi:MAG: SxtJ family membrane protein [Candidatus Neomarinimicrobiota bacterium]